jgi:hypothetical protein
VVVVVVVVMIVMIVMMTLQFRTVIDFEMSVPNTT